MSSFRVEIASGALAHYRLGSVRRALLPGLAPGVLLGTYAGATLAHALPAATLRAIFAIIVALTGLRYART